MFNADFELYAPQGTKQFGIPIEGSGIYERFQIEQNVFCFFLSHCDSVHCIKRFVLLVAFFVAYIISLSHSAAPLAHLDDDTFISNTSV